jgi:predicted Zn-dependent peptidase
MKYQKYEVGPYNLHIIKTDKFKTVDITVSFRRPLVKEEIVIRNFLSEILLQSSLKYPKNRLLIVEAEKLFGLNISSSCSRMGNYGLINFNLKILDKKYSQSDVLEKSLTFFSEILFNPHIDEKGFNKESFKITKNNIESNIKSIKDNLDRYASIKMKEHMDSKSPISYSIYRGLNDLEKITKDDLLKYYQSVTKSDLVDIFVLGDVDISLIKKIIKHFFQPINTIKRESVPIIVEHNKIRRRMKKVIESEKANQSKLSIGCKIINLTDFERIYVLPLCSLILGGGGTSLLFNTVREKIHSHIILVLHIC